MRSMAFLWMFALCAVSMAAPATDDDGGIAHDVGEGAGTAAGNVASGVRSAGQGIADAGGAAAGTVSGAASSAAEAARKTAAGARAGASSAMDGGRLSDAEIAAFALAANKAEIDAAQAVRKKTKNAQVKRFASDMIRDHISANTQATALVKRLGLTPEETELSRSVVQGAAKDLANLKLLNGKELDGAYARGELVFHRNVLAALDDRVIPSAQNADLKSLLESVRSVLAEHRDHAQALVDSMSK
jgi:putative membrane protein